MIIYALNEINRGNSEIIIITEESENSNDPYVQSFTTSSTWTVTHRLGYKPSGITLEISDEIALSDVDHVNNDVFTVSWTYGATGKVRCK